MAEPSSDGRSGLDLQSLRVVPALDVPGSEAILLVPPALLRRAVMDEFIPAQMKK